MLRGPLMCKGCLTTRTSRHVFGVYQGYAVSLNEETLQWLPISLTMNREDQNKKEAAGKTEEGIRKMKSIMLVLNRNRPRKRNRCELFPLLNSAIPAEYHWWIHCSPTMCNAHNCLINCSRTWENLEFIHYQQLSSFFYIDLLFLQLKWHKLELGAAYSDQFDGEERVTPAWKPVHVCASERSICCSLLHYVVHLSACRHILPYQTFYIRACKLTRTPLQTL